LLAGSVGGAPHNEGKMLCSCFQITEARIEQAIVRDGCATTAAVGNALKAGTNCGSCLPEIKQMLLRHQQELVA
jgi:assimilatory nitrate reductase catalytic subunit